MFIYENFKKILDNTVDLTNRIKTCPPEDTEELQMRIDSGIHAMRRMVSKIGDPDTRTAFMKSIQSLSTTVVEQEHLVAQARVEKKMGGNIVVDEELLKNSRRLKDMAGDFKRSLETDCRILDRVGKKMNSGSQETSKSLKVLERNSNWVKSSTFLSFTFMIFMVMYFIVRFS